MGTGSRRSQQRLKREREQKTVGRNDEVSHEDDFQEEFHLLCKLQLVENKNVVLKIKEKVEADPKEKGETSRGEYV